MKEIYQIKNVGKQAIVTVYWDDLVVRKIRFRGPYYGGNVIDFIHDHSIVSYKIYYENMEKILSGKH